jgi:ribosome-binding factor A
MKSMNQRQSKVAEEIRHITGMALLRGDVMSTVPLSRVNVTAAWVSADLRLARLYVALPETLDEKQTLLALNEQVAIPLRKVLAKQLATKYIPEVTFHASENDQ